MVRPTFTPRANCFINEFVTICAGIDIAICSATLLSSKPGHRDQPQSSRRGQDKDKRRTRPGHRAQPQSSGARPRQGQAGQEEDKAQPQSSLGLAKLNFTSLPALVAVRLWHTIPCIVSLQHLSPCPAGNSFVELNSKVFASSVI